MLSLDNSELLKWYKMAIRDDSEWRKAVARENSDFKLDGNLVFHNGKLFIPLSMHADILHNHHDSVISGHLGRACMLAFVQSDYSWPGMNMYVHNYVCVCNVCAHIKAPRHKPYGLLQPLDIPNRPWQSISMDFIVKLPNSHRYDSIWVVCDCLTHAAHFIPCKETIDAPGLAWLFLDQIFCHHRLRVGPWFGFHLSLLERTHCFAQS